jgi:hypothetical protein
MAEYFGLPGTGPALAGRLAELRSIPEDIGMNVRFARTARASAVLAGVLLVAGCGSAPHLGPTPLQPVTVPSTESPSAANSSWLTGIAASSASAVWAAGISCGAGCVVSPTAAERTLILRWDGSGWAQTASPSPGQADLNGISAGPGGAAWAVGQSCASACDATSPTLRPLILRWNGSTWSQTPSPGRDAELFGVSAGADGTAWAVGQSCTSGCGTSSQVAPPMILRWNGASWSQVPLTGAPKDALLLSVSAGPGGAAWAAGYSCTSGCGTTSAANVPLVLHWNGRAWVRTPVPGSYHAADISGVAAAPGGTAWAVGEFCASACGTTSQQVRTLVLHWNGTAWSLASSPSPGEQADLDRVSTGPAGTAWAVGHYCASGCGTTTEDDKTLILRWNGRAWSETPSPNAERVTSLNDVAVAPDGTAWAVGVSCVASCGTDSQQVKMVILRWNGRAWAAAGPVSGPTPTAPS